MDNGNGRRRKRSTRHSGLPSRDHDGWRIRWVDPDGKRRSRNFPANAYQEAVAELERIKGEARAVKDGTAPPRRTAPLFRDFVEKYWTPNRTDHKRSPKDDQSILRKHLVPAFGVLPLTRVTQERIEAFKGALGKDHSPKTVGNVLGLLGSILRYAHELKMTVELPRIRKPKAIPKDYVYIRTPNEMRAFLEAAREQGPAVHALLATAVFTGMRAGELFGLEWRTVDFDKRLILVERSFAKPTKSGNYRHVPILDPLLPILREWRLTNSGDLVFPNEVGNMHTPSPRIVKRVFRDVVKEAKLPALRFHDLRHTFASHWVMNGGDLFALQKVLGHADQQMVQRYAHLAPEAFEKYHGLFGSDAPKAAPVQPIKAAHGGKRKQA